MGLRPTKGDENSRRNRSLTVAARLVAATRYRAATMRERIFKGAKSTFIRLGLKRNRSGLRRINIPER